MMEVKNTVDRLPQFKKNVESLFTKSVIIGVLDNPGAQHEALMTEYGTWDKPSTPFFEPAIKKANEMNKIIMLSGAQQVLSGKSTTESVLDQVGKNTTDEIKKEGEDNLIPQSIIDNIGYKVV